MRPAEASGGVGGEAHVYYVVLEKRARYTAPHTQMLPLVASPALVRVFLLAPCIHGLLLLLVTIPGEKSGLVFPSQVRCC